MKTLVRQADLNQDRKLLMETVSTYLDPAYDERRFDWLYCQNPHGPARAWLSLDAANGEVVGMSAAFSRRVIIHGREATGWVLGDFCVAERCRSLGPALQLQRATLDSVGRPGESEFSLDFPGRQMVAIYQRFKIRPFAHLVRMAKPLRIDRKVHELMGTKALAQVPSWIGNALLRISDRRSANEANWHIAIHEGECGDEFTALWEGKPATQGIEAWRSAEFLNWRYLRHPLLRHQILTARKSGALKGYLVFSCSNGNAQIAEWCSGEDAVLLTTMIGNLISRLRAARLMTLSACLLDTDPRLPLLQKMGFWRRESSPVMMHWPGGETQSRAGWFLMNGDRDI